MKVNGIPYHTIWSKIDDESVIQIIDQRWLPHRFVIEDIATVDDMVTAIRDMHLRGAIVIGAAAAFGMYLAALQARSASDFDEDLAQSAEKLKSARPTAVNLAWGVDLVSAEIVRGADPDEKISIARAVANQVRDDEIERSHSIGEHGCGVIEEIAKSKPKKVINVLTHCNAGWLACVDYGTATAPIYAAHRKGIPIHVWVDETRPRNQGARLTAWELGQEGVPHTVIVDNAGGHLMQHEMVDLA